ncbi:SMI1/KNR4 family protein [Xenorhabdus sp. M]|uniref:SMI1/KNR4 family protein n=1 Tax=Xenorhabdus szentirmaii TaxID=290112 RepID=A0AAW3YPU8_9GAMM|nr:SMI1/KNR4 family protein [Xenorhabdus sp. M]MBD2800050.1 SMI1/KNR4 family protein [Xenorhabdus sp. M]
MKEIHFINKIKKLITLLNAKGLKVVCCHEQQILSLEEKQGKLPRFYKIYLLLIGFYSGDFKSGTDILFEEIDDINFYSIELMKENHIKPPENMFSFLLHQGYSSLFFVDRDDEDPPIYCYTEGSEIKKMEYKFSKYLLAEIDLYKKHQCNDVFL